MNQPTQLEAVFAAGALLALALTELSIRAAERFAILDRPAHRKTHKEPVPYLGGVAIFVSLTLALLIGAALQVDLPGYLRSPGFIQACLVLGCSLGVLLVGLLDDVRDLPARWKLLGQTLFAGLFVVFGFRFEVLHLPGLPPVELSYLSIPLTLFWILAVINAFNMVDGLDGLAATVSAGSLGLLAAACAMIDNPTGLLLSLAALGAVLGFLPFNWRPARIYLGDAGSGGLGMFLACSLVALGQTHGQPLHVPGTVRLDQPFFYQILIATLMVAYPALEITLSVSRRLLQGRPIFRADQGHLHHRFKKAGWSTRSICLAALAVNILPGLAALTTLARYHGWATWILSVCGVLFGTGLSTLGFLDFLKPKVVERLKPHFQIAHHFISMQKAKLGLAASRPEVLTLLHQVCQELGVNSYHFEIGKDPKGRGGWVHLHRWGKGLPAGPSRDHAALPDGKGTAEWVFEPHNEEEEELQVEYRVLISEFMREALACAWRLGQGQGTLKAARLAPSSHRSMSGHALRRRRKTR